MKAQIKKQDLIIVLYGSTGDLAFRKLVPAILSLHKEKQIPINTLVISLGRRDFTTLEYLEFVKQKNPNLDIKEISELFLYHNMQITDLNDYKELYKLINEVKNSNTRVIHYLAVSPNLMLDIANNISDSKLVLKGDNNSSLIFEKPFGFDLESSRSINESLFKGFTEEQIYRIDHYLGKNFINNLVDLRFKNKETVDLFIPSKIKQINVVAKEEVGILDRGYFYDETGALRDMFQSHLLQIIALLAMEKPEIESVGNIIDNKVRVLENLSYDKDKLVFGQYVGYLEEENIKKDSNTETLFKVKLRVKNEEFKNIDFFAMSGKKLSKRETYIELIQNDGKITKIDIYPNNEIITNDKVIKSDSIYIEYEKLIKAAVNYKKHKFLSWNEIEYSWKLTDEILKDKKTVVKYLPNTNILD